MLYGSLLPAAHTECALLLLLTQRAHTHHEHLAHVAGEPVHCRVPVVGRILLKCAKHNRQHRRAVLCNECNDVLMVPQEKAALSNLRARACVCVWGRLRVSAV